MSLSAPPRFALEHTFVRDCPGMYEPWEPATVPAPELVVLNEGLAEELGLDPAALRTPDGVAVLAGNLVPESASPVAQAYAGHQFGGYSPRLGDGRAVLLGELVDVHGRRRDLHLKGSGRTPFARGGDGKAALGPMLREHVIGEAMHALAIPTTRALAVVATGEGVVREDVLPGAVLARVASSHVRVGSFQYAAANGGPPLVQLLADHVIARHHPQALDAPDHYLALLEAVVEAQASLVAQWMLVGFVHGVMNTDNMTISGETIDYGPCAFMDAFDLATVFSSIDHGGRYAYGNQPAVAQWNLARLAAAPLPRLGEDAEQAAAAATEVLRSFPPRYHEHWAAGVRSKLGLVEAQPDDQELAEDLLVLLQAQQVDMTSAFRALSSALRGDEGRLRAHFSDPDAIDGWLRRWTDRLTAEGRDRRTAADDLDRVNPVYVPRNHLVEEALAAATEGDLGPYERLVDAVTRPFEERSGFERYAEPGAPDLGRYVTYCGT